MALAPPDAAASDLRPPLPGLDPPEYTIRVRLTAVARAAFTAKGLAALGETYTEDPRLLYEVYCLDRSRPLNPDSGEPYPTIQSEITGKPYPAILVGKTGPAGLAARQAHSPAFGRLLLDPTRRPALLAGIGRRQAPADDPTLSALLWRYLASEARRIWNDYAMYSVGQRDLALWGLEDYGDAEADTILAGIARNLSAGRRELGATPGGTA